VNAHVLASAVRIWRTLLISVMAGLVGLLVHSLLMAVKEELGILPGFVPFEDFQRVIAGLTGGRLGSLVPYLTGAMVWGFLYSQLHKWLPGRSSWVKGLSFALLAWGIMTTGFFLLSGHGLFGLRLGYGFWPAAFMFPMLAAFSVALSFVHTRLRR